MTESPPEAKPFTAIAEWLVAHHRQVLALTGLLTILSVALFMRMEFNADISSFMTEGSEEGAAFSELQEKYETSDPINIVLTLPEGETFLDGGALADLARDRDLVAALDEVGLVTSLVPETNPLTGEAFSPAFFEGLPAQAVGQIAGSNPFADLLLSADGRHTMLLAIPSGDGIAAVEAIQGAAFNERFAVIVSGNPAIFAEITGILSLFLLLIPPVIIVLLLSVFYVNVGDKRLTLLSIFPAIVGSLWTFGVIFGVGKPIDIVMVIVPIFVIVMGSADGLHFVTHFQDVAAKTDDPVERVRSTLHQVGKPMILTTVSTAVGFLSLFAADVGPIRQMGLFAAVGISLAGLISFFSLPAVLTLANIKGRERPTKVGGALIRGLQTAVRSRIPALGLAVVLVAFAAFSIPKLQVDADPLFMFGDDHELRQSFQATEDLFGGAAPLVGEFAFNPSDPVGSLADAKAATVRLESLPSVRSVVSVASLADALPPEQLAGVLSGEVELPTGTMVSDDGLRFMVLTQDLDGAGLDELAQLVESDPTITSLTGLTVIWDAMASLVLKAQIWSVATALLLVGIMLFATYRNLRLTLVAMVPLVLTIGVLLGFIGISGINLNLITAVASSIVIGVGIDYAIHFVAAIQHAERDGPGYVHRALQSAGRPIVANALGIAIGLTGLWLSPLAPHHHISLIMWVSMTVAAASALILIPALLPRDAVADS